MLATALPQVLRDNAVLILGLIAGVSLLLNMLLVRLVVRVRGRLNAARAAAEEAARSAALAAPGGIDPEAVIEVLRRGVPPTLDNVYAVMRRREKSRDAGASPVAEGAEVTSPT